MSNQWQEKSNRQAVNRTAIDQYRAESARQSAVATNTPTQQSMLRQFMAQNRPNGSFLSEDMRNDLADSGMVFRITNIRDGSTKFGPTWFVDILIDRDGFTDRYTMPMAHNDVRDRQLLQFMDALDSGMFNALPVQLISFDTAQGTGYSFDAPPDEYWAQTEIGGMPEYDMVSTNNADDTIPF